MVIQSKFRHIATTFVAAASLSVMAHAASAQEYELNYGHMNSPTSVVGMQADWLAEEIAKNTNGAVKIDVYPSSQLGKIQELAEGVSMGSIALSHNTAGALSSLYEDFGVLDTPYLYRDYDHLMNVVDINSPVMEELNQGLIDNTGMRVLYAFYFGTRQLTADRAIKTPADLSGVKIRAIPSPVYLTAVEGLGAAPVPVDWSEVPTALATGIVQGQENPVNVAVDHKLYDVQSHMMLTGHISAAEIVVINEDLWQSFPDDIKEGIAKAAETVRMKASQTILDKEAGDLAKLKEAGMTIIGPDDGLDVAAFRAGVEKLVHERFDEKFGKYYEQISAVK
ncbi:TRAP transporter substrate-binding protein [Thalassospira sp.]|uniref:TRAP transporter substrate-binding protein n=1 Tax=Thalassospira sp. TaxID=1912094 RepID=UPI000C3F2D8A|nr:TRAP transporter substrate-binding protein [Thalassospira sp.]MBC05946.1 ABC transporter substrate-binding protein [Thalassospira sp.]|tara:strand:+ start:3091 stop:4101 length:1011 start_codon:yes stop_codon:yes gene_type:complete